MRTYLLRRLLLMPVTLIGITFIVFCLTRMVPGGPIERIMQEHTMSALSGDKAGIGAVTSMSDADIERLEDLFNLREPTWLAYLQWLGVRRKAVAITREEMDDEGFARLTLTSGEGQARVLDVHREGTNLVYLTQPWFEEEGWQLRLESPHDRAHLWARRHRVTDENRIRAYEETPAGSKWRVVAYRKAYNGLLQGSLGRSYKYGEPVINMIAERLPVSLYLGLLGAFITYLVSIPLGVFKALMHKSFFDSLSSILIFIGYAVPGFALGALMLVYLGARLEWFPLYGLVSPNFEQMGFWDQCRDLMMHTALPLTCYVVSTFAMTTMMTKNCLMEQLSADYVRTAVAKGVSYRVAVFRHALRNALIPIASTFGSVICTVVAGSVLIERVFDIQGFGMLSYQALMDKDYTLMMGALLLTSVFMIIGNLLSDIIVAFIDPRIRFES